MYMYISYYHATNSILAWVVFFVDEELLGQGARGGEGIQQEGMSRAPAYKARGSGHVKGSEYVGWCVAE